MLRNRNNKQTKKQKQQQQQKEKQNENQKINKSKEYIDEEDDEYSEDDDILNDLNESKTQNQINRKIEKEKQNQHKESQFFDQILSGLFEHNYISGVIVFNYDGIVIASKNIDVSKFPKNGVDLHRYFEKNALGQRNKDVISECGRDLMGPGYMVEGIGKNSVYCFNSGTKCGFSLEKTRSIFILGCFNDKQDKIQAYSVIGSMADDFRYVYL